MLNMLSFIQQISTAVFLIKHFNWPYVQFCLWQKVLFAVSFEVEGRITPYYWK